MEKSVPEPFGQTPQAGQPELANNANGPALASFVCGILAICFNLLVITAVVGLPLAVVSLFLGLFSLRHGYGKAGVALSLFSLLIAFIYLASYMMTLIVDPFI